MKAVAYYRTSSHANVGLDKGSLARQQDAVKQYADAHGIEIVREFYDGAVSGADPLDERPGFVDLLQYMMGNGARTILVENASRFARDLAVQIAGHDLLKAKGFTLVTVDAPDYFVNETPTAEMVRQILGAVSQFEKASVVERLRKGRAKVRAEGGYAGGFRETIDADHAKAAKALRTREDGSQRPLREIATLMAESGMVSTTGKPYGPDTVSRLLKRA